MDGAPPPEEDFSALPVVDRLGHKNWKARVSGYETLIKTFQNTASETDAAFRPFLNDGDLLKKIATDANAVAQEKGVEVLVALVKFAGENAARTREAVMPAVVDKCIGSTRAGTKNQSIELVLQYVEMENSADGCVRDLVGGLAAKQPKAVAGCVSAMKEIVRVFGIQPVSPPLILKALPKIFGHTDKTVRAEGTFLCQFIYQCIGAAIQPALADLKPVQVKELTESFEKLDADGKGKGTLLPEQPEEIDPRSFAEEVNVASQLPAGFHANLASSKWKERKEALDDFLAVLQKAELGEIIKALASKMADVNIACVIAAANSLECLAKGLMDAFSKHKDVAIPPMLARLKERKATVTDAIGAALDAVFATTTISDILELVLPSLADKSPQVKEGTVKFIQRSLSTATKPPAPAQVKPLADALVVALADSMEPVRVGAAHALGCLMKIVGERAMNPILEPLDDLRKGKVKEQFEKAVVKCKVGSAAPPKPAAPPPAAAPKKKAPAKKQEPPKSATPPPQMDDEPLAPTAKSPAKAPPARLLAKKAPAPTAAAPAVKKAPASSTAAAPAAKGGPAPGSLDTFKFKHTPEVAEELAADMIPGNIANDLGDANWKLRLAASEEMISWLEGGAVDTVESEVVVRFLFKKVWNEKNFQVSAKVYSVLSILADRCPTFGRPSVALAVSHLSEKLGDMKLKKPAGDTLGVFAERTSLSFVLNQAYEPLSKQKAPKVIADSIAWINVALQEFGIAGLSLRPLIDFLKEGLKNSNAAVRTSATNCIITVKLFAGPSIKDLIQDLNPQLLATITSEFDKVDGKPAPTPTRVSAEAASAPSAGGGKSGSADPLDDLFPRVELDKLLVGTNILTDAKSDAWKSRKEALEQLQAILDVGQNKRLKPSMGEIKEVLKIRITDTNKAVQVLALDIVSRIASGMNRPFEKFTKMLVPPICSVLSDQKANIRSAGLVTLSAIATACEGIDAMISGIGTGLETTNPAQRSALASWVADYLKEHEASQLPDLSALGEPLVLCLEDRNGDVRKAAQEVLGYVIAQVGFDKVANHTSGMKPASKTTVLPLLQAAKANAPASLVQAGGSTKLGPSKAIPAASAVTGLPPPPLVAERSASPAPNVGRSVSGVKATGLRRMPAPAAGSGASRPESRAESEISPGSALGPSSRLGKPAALGGLRRPAAGSAPTQSAQSAPVAAAHPVGHFIGSNAETKKSRLSKDTGKWVVEGPPVRKEVGDTLAHQMEGHVSEDVLKRLFSGGHDPVADYVLGIVALNDSFTTALAGELDGVSGASLRAILLANIDLPLKYISLRIHEPPPNLVTKCLDLLENILSFLRSIEYQLTDAEAQCFIPTIVHKLGDGREPVRNRVSLIIQSLPRVCAYSRVFSLLLEHGLRSKVARTRQGALDELGVVLKRSGLSACEPSKALPVIASFISDKDSNTRKSALGTLGDAYSLVGDRIWTLVGPLNAKDKTQLEERLRRITPPAGSSTEDSSPVTPSISRVGGLVRPSSPAGMGAHPTSPTSTPLASRLPPSGRAGSPGPAAGSSLRPPSMLGSARARPTSMLPSRLAGPRTVAKAPSQIFEELDGHTNGYDQNDELEEEPAEPPVSASDDITITISSILSNDPGRSVDALKRIQKILEVPPDSALSSPEFQTLAEHTEGLIETISLQMGHVFDKVDHLVEQGNFRLAKHLIQTLNSFCDHAILAESLTVGILQTLLEELTLRLLNTDESKEPKIKDLSRFINMLILRLFAVAKRVSIFRALFGLLLHLVKPFPANGTLPDAPEAKVAELVLKCVWKLARNIPGDLEKGALDPVELFPAIEIFLQSIPPNEWRARATNRVPSGDMPLRTIKVIIQHIVAHFGSDDTYEILTQAFEDPSATIVYPYVFRILNSNSRTTATAGPSTAVSPRSRTRSVVNGGDIQDSRRHSPSPPRSAVSSSSVATRGRSPSPARVRSSTPPPTTIPGPEEPDPDVLLLKIIDHISSETTGALHKEGITELYQFLKKYPNRKPKVDKLLEATGPAFRKYIARALASRAAEDPDRELENRSAAAATTGPPNARPELTKVDTSPPSVPSSPSPRRRIDSTAPAASKRMSVIDPTLPGGERLSRLHDIFKYRANAATKDENRVSRASMTSTGSGSG
ncbi:ARM repeat-containing protein [Auriculariales sp. MPI-PUGE-AT-0066]|nr:ARM repeat-containing protein [Auriculariales sp. MPI-PUGE-AT-0066]